MSKRHRWMAYVPYELTTEDGLRMIGKLSATPGPPGANQLAGDEKPAPGDTRPFLGTHNIVNDLVAVGCFDCEEPMTEENAYADCPGDPSPSAVEMRGSNVAAGLGSVGRNDPCPCGSGQKFKRCHGA